MSIYQNQRKQKRSNISGHIRYFRDPEEAYNYARLFDCGENGMGLILSCPYLKDTELFLKSMGDTEKDTMRAEVAWSRPVLPFNKKYPQYRVGLKMT